MRGAVAHAASQLEGSDDVPCDGSGLSMRRRHRRWRRARGSLRLIAFGAVIALIIGTSVTLASADSSDDVTPVAKPSSVRPAGTNPAAAATRRERASAPFTGSVSSKAVAGSTKAVATTTKAVGAEKASGDAKVTPYSTTVVDEPVVSQATRAPSPSTIAATSGNLPLTGIREVRFVVLGGSLLMLLGMLTQIAGQPLPARAHSTSSRTRRASRTT